VDLSARSATLTFGVTTYVWADGTGDRKFVRYTNADGNPREIRLSPEQVFRTSLEHFQTEDDLDRYILGDLAEVLVAGNSGVLELDANGEVIGSVAGIYEIETLRNTETNTITGTSM